MGFSEPSSNSLEAPPQSREIEKNVIAGLVRSSAEVDRLVAENEKKSACVVSIRYVCTALHCPLHSRCGRTEVFHLSLCLCL